MSGRERRMTKWKRKKGGEREGRRKSMDDGESDEEVASLSSRKGY